MGAAASAGIKASVEAATLPDLKASVAALPPEAKQKLKAALDPFPMVVYATREIDQIYKMRFAEYAAKATGVRCCFTFVDQKDAKLAHELLWFNDEASYAAEKAKYEALGKVKTMIKFGGDGATPLLNGFIKKDGAGLKGPPVIVITKRHAKAAQ